MYCQITVYFLSIRFLLFMQFCCCCVMLTIFFWLCSLYQMLNLSRKHSDIGFIRSISVKLLSIRRKNSFSTRFPQNLAKFKKRTLVIKKWKTWRQTTVVSQFPTDFHLPSMIVTTRQLYKYSLIIYILTVYTLTPQNKNKVYAFQSFIIYTMRLVLFESNFIKCHFLKYVF